MKLPTPKQITMEALGGDVPEYVETLLEGLRNVDPLYAMAQGGVGVDNLNAVVKTFEAVVPEAPWIAPTLQNSWVNYGSGYTDAGYRILPGGVVELRGLIKSGTATAGTVLFSLPAGYRPSRNHIFPVVSVDAFGEARVQSGGDVTILVGVNTWFCLDSIHFQAAGAAAAPAPFSNGDWPVNLKVAVKGTVLGVLPLTIQDSDAGTSVSVGAASVDWEPLGAGQVRLRAIHGLQPGRKYKVAVLVLGSA